MADKVFSEIASGSAALKHVETTDKSAPVIEGGVQLKKHDRGSLLTEVQAGTELKHADTVDKSAPAIADAKVGQNSHATLFSEIKQKGGEN